MFVSLANYLSILEYRTFIDTLEDSSVYLVFVFSFLFLGTSFWDKKWLRQSQIALTGVCGVVAIIDVYNSIHGLGMVLITVFMAFKYGVFDKRPIVRSLIAIAFTFCMIEISARMDHPNGQWVTGLDAIAYLGLFLFITYLIYSDEIKAYIAKAKHAEAAIDVLRNEREELLEQLSLLDEQIAALQEDTAPFDLDEAGITPRETEVIKALVLFRDTEKELAERLSISPHTVKEHFRHIRRKLGVAKQVEIIDLCRNNFK